MSEESKNFNYSRSYFPYFISNEFPGLNASGINPKPFTHKIQISNFGYFIQNGNNINNLNLTQLLFEFNEMRKGIHELKMK